MKKEKNIERGDLLLMFTDDSNIAILVIDLATVQTFQKACTVTNFATFKIHLKLLSNF